MKLLIVTQAVDLDDPVLGFFHRWIVEFSKRCETVHVICLKEGRHALPRNVLVHSLGKEQGSSRAGRLFAFYGYLWKFGHDYDAVFVHMNPEYVVLGGLLWRLSRKPVGLWYVHWATSLRLRIAVFFATVVFTAREGSMPVATRKKRVVGHGIDTNAFKPAQRPPRPDSILFLGRLDPVKRADRFIEALERLHEQGVAFCADIVGSPSDPHADYAHRVRNLAAPMCLDGVLSMRGAVGNDEASRLFASHAIFCKLSPRGQFDKTMLEALASGCLVVSTDPDLSDIVPPELLADDDIDSLAKAIRAALEMPEEKRRATADRSRAWVVKEHSLEALTPKIIAALSV